MRMFKTLRILRTFLFYALCACAILCILLQEITAWALVLGGLLGVLFPLFLHMSLQTKATLMAPLRFARYYLLLCKDMACASVWLCTSLFHKERAPVHIAKLKAEKSKDEAVRIANSITLTPGTVTLDYAQDTYHVLYLHGAAQEKEDIVRTFEHRIGGDGV